MRHIVRFALSLLVGLCSVNVGHAIPHLINFQGILTDGGGTPITVATDVEFRIWDMAAGGTQLWTETQSVTPNADGRFTVLLGAITPIPSSAILADSGYLGITVAPDAEMAPRTRLASVAYAYRAGTVDGATGGTISGDLLLQSSSPVNAMEIVQSGIGRGLRVAMDNGGSTESGVAIVMQSGGPALGIVTDGGGPAIDVIGGFGDGSVNLPGGSISGFEITDASITSSDLAAGSVNTGAIINGTILNEDVAVSEIASDRLKNEPGAAQSVSGASFGLTNSVASYRSVTINAPTDGYALVIASATVGASHNTGADNYVQFGVSETGTALDSDQTKEWRLSSALPTGAYRAVVSAQKIFPAVSGSNTYHLAAIDAGGPSVKTIGDMTLSVVFISTAYGTVSQ